MTLIASILTVKFASIAIISRNFSTNSARFDASGRPGLGSSFKSPQPFLKLCKPRVNLSTTHKIITINFF